MRYCLVVLLAAGAAASAADVPKTPCIFDDFPPAPSLVEIAAPGKVIGYFGCSEKGCLETLLGHGEPLILLHTDGAWTCAYFDNRDGAAPTWVRSSDIRNVTANPNPAVADWVGTWRQAHNHISVEPARVAGALRISGEAIWKGPTSAHDGSFEGDATPAGNHVHVSDNGCAVDLALIGRYLITSDNSQCGGMNVRFQGIWRRAAR